MCKDNEHDYFKLEDFTRHGAKISRWDYYRIWVYVLCCRKCGKIKTIEISEEEILKDRKD